jgi:glycosyltransferase involved in cell wall biosynthesis
MKTLSIVFPCYNEAKNIPLILERFAQVMDRDDVEVILVDNGSSDDSPQVLAALLPHYPFARSVRVEVNQGYGYGLFCGLQAGTGRFLGWTHADMQTDPQDVLRGLALLEASANPDHTFVKGWRRGRPWADQVFTVGMAIFESLVLWAPLWEINAQPNLFPRELFAQWQDPPTDFSFDLYYYYLAVKSGFKIQRFDVEFGQRLHGQSRWNINWQAKVKFIQRTVDFTFKLKRKIRHSKQRIRRVGSVNDYRVRDL